MLNTEVKSKLMPILETVYGMTNVNDIIRLTHVKSLAQNHLRVDVVFDVYGKDSLKGEIRRKVTGNTRSPHAWNTFIQCNENKTGLFVYSRQFFFNKTNSSIVVLRKKMLSATKL